MTVSQHFSELVASLGEALVPFSGQPVPFESQASEVDVFDAELRRWRNQQMAAIAQADIAREIPVAEALLAVTEVAEAATQAAVNFHQRQLQARYGECLKPDGEAVAYTVLGMGKLGGGELNFSSDIDLICLYDQPGVCTGERAITAEEFFGKVTKAVAGTLGKITADGFVFRVDLRLRPFGGSGPLVMHFDQAENYYETQGRDWERYAFIKARPIAGDIAAGNEFLARLRPFIYRRYLDFTALHGLRELKEKIEQQYALKRLDENIKLGPGGIREVEFIAQSFQLIRGGQHIELQTQSLYQALRAASQLELLDPADADGLITAYEFLRSVENRLQQRADQQVHHLPQQAKEQQQLAQILGYENWETFISALDQQRNFVRQQFASLLVTGTQPDVDVAAPDLAVPVVEKLEQLRQGVAYQQLSERAVAYVDVIVQRLSGLALEHNLETAQLAILQIVDRILGRTTYLALLAEQSGALERLGFFVARSRWMAQQIEAQPHLLDELLDDRQLQSLPDKPAKQQELQALLRQVPANDLEMAMDATRRFKSSVQFRVAAADVAGYLPVMRVSDHLSELAEVVLQTSLDWVAAELQQKTGRPQLLRDGETINAQMLVVGYGKLGGLELGYGSDLDIVLLHDGDGKALGTNGDKPLENAVYFQRLGQRFVHFLSANTPAGRLYEIDTRLRPSGKSGLLVTSIQGYERYQRENAWTWEHQALVRARAVAGPEFLLAQYAQLRLDLLAIQRDDTTLKQEVIEMRNKMREHLDDGTADKANLKHSPGGLVDIEFLCQYLVLRQSASQAGQFAVTDNVRQIEALAQQQALSAEQAELLTLAYIAIRGASHHQKLGCELGCDLVDLNHHRQQVVAIWQELLE